MFKKPLGGHPNPPRKGRVIKRNSKTELKEDEKAPHDENSAILGQLKMAECEPYQLTVDR